jgi:hypothetical protein
MAKDSDSGMYVASESFVDSEGHSYHKDITRVSARLVSKNKWKHLFKPLDVSHPDVEKATAAPGEKRGDDEEPAAEKSKAAGLSTESMKGK